MRENNKSSIPIQIMGLVSGMKESRLHKGALHESVLHEGEVAKGFVTPDAFGDMEIIEF